MKKYLPLAMLAAHMALASMPATAQTAADSPSFSITPYLWLPNMNGTFKYSLPPNFGGATTSDAEVGPNSYLSNMKMMIMVSGEMRYNDWSVFTDLVHLDFSSADSTVREAEFGGRRVSIDASSNVQTQSSLSGTAWTLAGGRTLFKQEGSTTDGFAGFRYAGLKASTDWQLSAAINGPGAGQSLARTGSISENVDLWDAIIGVRGRVKLGENWSLPYYLDAGKGSSDVTWQAMVGVTYAFTKWAEMGVVYRHLAYDQSENKLLQDFSFSGPAVSATFRF